MARRQSHITGEGVFPNIHNAHNKSESFSFAHFMWIKTFHVNFFDTTNFDSSLSQMVERIRMEFGIENNENWTSPPHLYNVGHIVCTNTCMKYRNLKQCELCLMNKPVNVCGWLLCGWQNERPRCIQLRGLPVICTKCQNILLNNDNLIINIHFPPGFMYIFLAIFCVILREIFHWWFW